MLEKVLVFIGEVVLNLLIQIERWEVRRVTNAKGNLPERKMTHCWNTITS